MRILIFTIGILNILKNKTRRWNLRISEFIKIVKIWHFREFCQKISIETNYENSHRNNFDIWVKMCFITPENCFWAIQILQILSHNTPKIKTFFGYACMEVHQFCHDWARNNNVSGSLNEPPVPHPSYFNVFKIAHTEYG